MRICRGVGIEASDREGVLNETTMAKQETIKYLTDLMGLIQNAYFSGRLGERNGDDTCGEGVIHGELWVREDIDLHSPAINIDLYDFGGTGKDFVEGLQGVTPYHGEDTESKTGWVYNIGYNPDDEHPLYFDFSPDDESDDYTILPETLPEDLLKRIAAWLEREMQSKKTTNPLLSCTEETLNNLLAALSDATNEIQGEREFSDAMQEPVFEKMTVLSHLVLKTIAVKTLKKNENK